TVDLVYDVFVIEAMKVFNFFFSSRRRHTISLRDWSSDVCSSDLLSALTFGILEEIHQQLGFNGGSINPSAKVEDGTPVYTAVGSNYTFNALKKQDANNRNRSEERRVGEEWRSWGSRYHLKEKRKK